MVILSPDDFPYLTHVHDGILGHTAFAVSGVASRTATAAGLLFRKTHPAYHADALKVFQLSCDIAVGGAKLCCELFDGAGIAVL